MRFETILDYVKLPYWKPKERITQDISVDKSAENTEPKGNLPPGVTDLAKIKPDPYTVIFDWLWNSQVRKIFTVEVDDDGLEPHTNAAIRESFTGETFDSKATRDFKVEVWKWKKFDICSDAIVAAAPTAREVHLYSYGNTAVLKSWACLEGLKRLKHASESYRLKLHILTLL